VSFIIKTLKFLYHRPDIWHYLDEHHRIHKEKGICQYWSASAAIETDGWIRCNLSRLLNDIKQCKEWDLHYEKEKREVLNFLQTSKPKARKDE